MNTSSALTLIQVVVNFLSGSRGTGSGITPRHFLPTVGSVTIVKFSAKVMMHLVTSVVCSSRVVGVETSMHYLTAILVPGIVIGSEIVPMQSLDLVLTGGNGIGSGIV